MAGKRAKSPAGKVALPNPGDAFLMPVEDGRFGVCRVLRHGARENWLANGGSGVLAAASSWIGRQPPDVSDLRLREILVLNHHAWKNVKEMNWVNDPAPPSFRYIGVIPPSPAEKRATCGSSASWEHFPQQLYSQWRWDHERAEVLRDDASEKEAGARRQAADD